MNRYTWYYVNQSAGGGEIGPVYRASFRVQRGNGVGCFFRGIIRFVKHLFIQGQRPMEGALKTGLNILTDEINNQSEQPVGGTLKTRFGEAKDNHDKKLR
jgi:hypothetical protein